LLDLDDFTDGFFLFLFQNIIARPAATTTTTAAVSTGSTTSTVSTINSTVINNNLRVAQTSQLSSRLQSKPTTVYSPNKSNVDLKVIDLTDEEDRAKSSKYLTVFCCNYIQLSSKYVYHTFEAQ
jgi:hypothetical protein